MNPVNLQHIPLPLLREMFNATFNDDVVSDRNFSQLDIALNSPATNFKLIHHLLIARYAKVTMHHKNSPIQLVGLDIETDHTTGEPKLLGFEYPDGYYFSDESPTLQSLFGVVNGLINNSKGTHIVTWGNLDISCIIRLFDPVESERRRVSSGIGGNFQDGEWKALPPVLRNVNGTQFYIDHYISGRSLRLGVIHGKRNYTVWVYNLSQFYQTKISETAKALGLEWVDYDKSTHLIDWIRFGDDPDYYGLCIASNKQDASTVRKMAEHLTATFHSVFGAYPSLLVSAGSLADAAVSKLLTTEEYASNSWRYLSYSTFKNSPFIQQAEALLSEAFSAGYVDQFAIGYFPEIHTADISSAYPHKIRELPDLRECKLFAGNGDPTARIRRLESEGYTFFTAAIRGTVNIPEHLTYHPITVRTAQRQNIRPLGTFGASYLYEERQFCLDWGARFTNESWVIFAVKEWKPAPIAKVSQKLADMRSEFRQKMQSAVTSNERILYDSMQYMVKVVDNSLYGKNVMTTEIVEDIDGKPTITGYKAGDRFNLLYGCVITARTRVQLAEAMMQIAQAGGRPILAMTDSVYWQGEDIDLPPDMVAQEKVAGKFEPVSTVNDFYLVKTGQYEYRTGDVYHHKMRGINVPYENRSTDNSFYRRTISEWISDKSAYLHPEEIEIPVSTRKLVTIGSTHLDRLGLVEDGESLMRPFVLSGKQVEPYILDWHKAINGAVWLKPAIATVSDDAESPFQYLSGIHENGGGYITRHERKKIFYLLQFKITGKCKIPRRRLSDMSWTELEDWSGIKREWCNL